MKFGGLTMKNANFSVLERNVLDDSANQSERACTKAVEVDPTNHALNNRGVFRLSKGDLFGARKDFDRCSGKNLERYKHQ